MIDDMWLLLYNNMKIKMESPTTSLDLTLSDLESLGQTHSDSSLVARKGASYAIMLLLSTDRK